MREGGAYILITVLPSSASVLGRISKSEENDETSDGMKDFFACGS